jgi:hypothetical protein
MSKCKHEFRAGADTSQYYCIKCLAKVNIHENYVLVLTNPKWGVK